MDNESFVGVIIMAVCCFGCALTFSGIGIWANKSKKPIHFWSGTEIAPEKVTDIPAYNHANAVMWKWYAVPYWVAGLLGCLGFLGDGFTIAAAILLFIACFPGIFMLVGQYRKIEKQYMIR